MSDGPEWFAPKRFGIGPGLPISWQGWALNIVYVAGMIGSILLFEGRATQIIATMIPLTLVFLVIAGRTTRGGWRWRWREED